MATRVVVTTAKLPLGGVEIPLALCPEHANAVFADLGHLSIDEDTVTP